MKIKGKVVIGVVVMFLLSSLMFGGETSQENEVVESVSVVSNEEVEEVTKPTIHTAKPPIVEEAVETEEVQKPTIHRAQPDTNDVVEADEEQMQPILNKETIAVDKYDIIISDKGILYEFAKEKAAGSFGIVGSQDEILDYECYFGTKSVIQDNSLSISVYSHTAEVTQANKIAIQGLGGFKEEYADYNSKFVIEWENIDTTTLQTINLDYLPNGIYKIYGAYKIGDNSYYTVQYLYVNGDDSQLCRYNKSVDSAFDKTVEDWYDFIAQIDIDEMLELEGIIYPVMSVKYGHECNHVSEWAELSHEIIRDDTWSDAAKVWAMFDYIRKNYAYDSYKVAQETSRARMEYDSMTTKVAEADVWPWSNDNNFMYYNGVGVCWDFVNALAIMCREQGIPCTDISDENSEHTLSAVYIEGFWIPIDIASCTFYRCNNLDPTILDERGNARSNVDNFYGNYSHGTKYAYDINEWILME